MLHRLFRTGAFLKAEDLKNAGDKTEEAGLCQIKDIRNRLNMTASQFNPCRMRLIRREIVNGETHGFLTFTLPVFREFNMDESINEEYGKMEE